MGGLGSRLRPLTFEKPKPLLPIGGRPALWHLLNSLVPLQVERVFLACRYGINQFRQFDQELGSPLGFKVEIVEEDSERGTGGALAALPLEDFRQIWVFNGDTLMDLDTRAMLSIHQATGCSATMAVVSVENPGRYGSVSIERERLRGFVEKHQVQAGPGWINAGAYLIEGPLWKSLEKRQPLSLEREVFPQWIESGSDLGVYRHSGYFIDIGTPEAYLQSQAILLTHRSIHPTANIHPQAHLEGALSIGADCIIGAGVHLFGPTTLGRQVHLGVGCWVKNSVIWDKVRVGSGSRLTRCILGSQVELAANTFAKDQAKVCLTPLEPAAWPLEIQFGEPQ